MDDLLPPHPRPHFGEKELIGFKYFGTLGKLLGRLHEHKQHPNRELHYDQYATVLLLYFFNPVISSLRGLQFATGLEKVQAELGIKRTSLGSFSEASHVFDPQLLQSIFAQLSSQACAADALPRPQGLPEGLQVIIEDGTLLNALPRMVWALWRLDQRAVTAHLQFNLFRAVPVTLELTPGQGSEKQVLEQLLIAGCLYLIDRGYASYALFQKIMDAKSSFVCRVQDNTVYEVVKGNPLTPEAQKAGILEDVQVRLGSLGTRENLSAPVRLIKVQVQVDPKLLFRAHYMQRASANNHRVQQEGGVIVLVTDRFDLPAELIALLYKYRWQIELFFRWFKCVLGCKHLLAESENGIRIQLYVALIASLLVVLWTGRKPTKRTLEIFQHHLNGWATLEEVDKHIAGLKNAR